MGGGAALQRRLFGGYTGGALIYVSAFPDPEARMPQWLLHEYAMNPSPSRGKWGLGRARLILSCMPGTSYVRRLKSIFERHHIQAVHAVAHEFLWISAIVAAKQLELKIGVAVHDHWPSTVAGQLPKVLGEAVWGALLRQADVVYTAHEEASAMLWGMYQIQAAGVERDGLEGGELSDALSGKPSAKVGSSGLLTVGYAGMYHTYKQEISDLHQALRVVCASDTRFRRFRLVACTDCATQEMIQDGWQAEEVANRGWQEYEKVAEAMEDCDFVFLPMSFERQHADRMRWGMPVKTVPYLRSRRPILVYGPPYSSVAGLFSECGGAVVVTEHGPGPLLAGIRDLLEARTHPREAFERQQSECLEERFNLTRIRSMVYSSLGLPAAKDQD